VLLAKPDIEKSEVYFTSPQVLPGGRQILLSAVRGQTGRILALNPRTGARETLLENAQNGQFIAAGKSPNQGYLIYYAEANRSLVAASFDADRLRVKGDPVPVIESSLAGRNNAYGRIVVSNTGTLLYAPQMLADPQARHTLVWVDLQGAEQPLGAPARDYRWARVSPVDPNRIAMEIAGDTREIWTYDSDRGALDRIAAEGLFPIWTPDGKEILYQRSSQSGATPAIMAAAADRSSGPAVLATSEKVALRPRSISSDGKFLLGDYGSEKGLWALPLDRSTNGAKPRSIIESEFKKTTPEISPDGRWVAYVADDTGRPEVYVSSFPEAGPKITISTDGGNLPRWGRNGRELFYRSGDRLMAVDIQAGPPFRAGRPKMLFGGYYSDYPYDVAQDGQHFLMIKPAVRPEGRSNDQVIIVFNWFDDLRRRMAPPK
jgi:Tol biopolymer transport system component